MIAKQDKILNICRIKIKDKKKCVILYWYMKLKSHHTHKCS